MQSVFPTHSVCSDGSHSGGRCVYVVSQSQTGDFEL